MLSTLMRYRALAGAVTFALVATTACGPGYAPAGITLAIRRPPPDRVEVREVTPGPGYVWIRGHYTWQAGDYVWVGGRWEQPPQASYRRYVPGHWAHARGGYYWVEGRWS